MSTSLRGITSKHYENLYCLNCPHSFSTEKNLTSHEKVFNNKDYCGIVMPSEKDKLLEFKQYMKSDKIPYIIYADIGSLILKIQKNLQQKKLESIFFVDIQRQQFGDLTT